MAEIYNNMIKTKKHFTYKKLVGAGALLITLIFSYVGCKPWADIWVLNCSTVGNKKANLVCFNVIPALSTV